MVFRTAQRAARISDHLVTNTTCVIQRVEQHRPAAMPSFIRACVMPVLRQSTIQPCDVLVFLGGQRDSHSNPAKTGLSNIGAVSIMQGVFFLGRRNKTVRAVYLIPIAPECYREEDPER